MRMKYWMLGCLLAATLACAGCGDTQTENQGPATGAKAEPTHAEFHIQGLSGGLCKFIGVIGTTNFIIDSMPPAADGSLVLKQDTALPAGLYYLLLPDQRVIQFLLEQDQTFSLSTESSNLVGAAKVEGSLDNELLYENLRWEENFQLEFQPVAQRFNATPPGSPEHAEADKQQRELLAKRKAHLQGFKDKHPNAFFTAYKLAGQNPELQEPRRPDGSIDQDHQIFLYRKAYWDNTSLSDERLLHTPIIANKLTTYITQITPQVTDSVIKYADIVIEKSRANQPMFKFVANWIAIEYNKPKTMGLEAVFVHVIDKYFTDELAFWSTPKELEDIRKSANEMRPSLIGKIGQDLECENLSKKKESLYGLKSPWTVLWIWNYECEHCQERTPAMKQVLERYRSRGLEVYSLCTGMEEQEWRNFVAKYGIQGFHNVWDPQYASNYYQKYHIDNTPELYLLDKDHRIVAKDLHPDQLPEQLERLIAGK